MKSMVIALLGVALVAAQEPDPITMIQVVGEFFSLSFANGQPPVPLTFRISGLPRSSGIRLAQNGTLWGTPNLNDFNAPQPLNLTVNVSSSQGSVTFPLIIGILGRKPVADLIQTLFVRVGEPIPAFNVPSLLQLNPLASRVIRASGFPKNSGFSVNASGVLNGTATAADLAARQPLNITIVVRDQTNLRTFNIFLVILPQRPVRPIVSVDTLVAVFNQSFTMDLRPLYAPLRPSLTLAGTPEGSSIRLVDGILQGKPNAKDLNAKQPIQLVITLRDERTGIDAYFFLILSIIPRAPTTNTSVSFFIRQGDDLGVVNASALLPAATSPTSVVWSIQGLPPKSGLSFDSTRGLLRGSPNKQDYSVKQPFIITIAANTRQGKPIVSLAVILTVLADGNNTTTPTQSPPRPTGAVAVDPAAPPTLSGNVRSVKVVAIVGKNFSYDLKTAFASNRQLSLIVRGLPNTGLAVNASGFLEGTPKASLANLANGKLIEANVTASTLPANNPNRQTLTIPIYLAVLDGRSETNGSTAYFVHQGDTVSNIDLSPAFGPKPYTLSFTGLPQGSGLSVKDGVVSGRPNSADRSARQPLQIILTARRPNIPTISFNLILAILPPRT